MKMSPAVRRGWLAPAALALSVAFSGPVAAQETTPSPTPTPAPAKRASWLSDGVALRAGDIVTVIVDEQTSSSERVSRVGSDQHSLGADFSIVSDGEVSAGPSGVDSRWRADSREVGEANRQGGLYGVLTARVVGIDGAGMAEIEGHKSVKIDGREQELTLHGFVRPADVAAGNVVHSTRLAEANVTYKGKNIGPKKGIFGKILSILWPF